MNPAPEFQPTHSPTAQSVNISVEQEILTLFYVDCMQFPQNNYVLSSIDSSLELCEIKI